MSAGSRLLLLGLRGSGKTSYLAALWHLIEAGDIASSLKAAVLQPNREYLNRIRDSWLKFQEVGRTSLRAQETISLLLQDTTTGNSVDITIPDLSGESLRLQWAMRKATTLYTQFAQEACGLLLFIHPDTVRKIPLIPPAKDKESDVAGKSGSPVSSPDQESTARAQEVKLWSPELTPTQVQLVELLQFANWLRPANRTFRVAVVVSAWDMVQDQIPPVSWVEHRLPLLFQYLVANAEVVPFYIYGVSALGGNLTNDLARLQKEMVPANRIKVVDQNLKSHHDLTTPLRFLLALDRDEAGTAQRHPGHG
jgi:hypothetical protein